LNIFNNLFKLMAMNSVVLSIDYQSAPMSLLEKVASNKDDKTHYLTTLLDTMFFNEMVIISTCNRSEWVFTSPDYRKALAVLFQCIKDRTGISESVIRRISNIYVHNVAIQHLFEVTCGLKSMVIGENEILTQVKNGHSFCMEFGATGSELNKLFQTVVATGKNVRTNTKISSGAHSISSIAIEAIRHHNPNFIHEPMLLVGAGVMIQRALVKLNAMGHTSLFVANRTMSRAEEMAETFNAITVLPFAAIRQKLHEFRTIYVALSTRDYLIRRSDLQFSKQSQTLVDLGVPRNIDPDCDTLPHTKLISMGALEAVSNNTIDTRTNDITKVNAMIAESRVELNRWQAYRTQAKSWPVVQYA